VQYQIQPKPNTYFRIRPSAHGSFQPHLHGFYELIWCEMGQILVTVAGREYVLHAGDATLIFPYQVHSYAEQPGALWHLCTFAPELIASFAGQYAECMPESNQFRFSCDISGISCDSSIFAKKSFLYSMCDAATSQMTFVHASADGRYLLEKLFVLIEKYYTLPEFSLRWLSQKITYDYGYLSKFFYEKTGMKFNYYLNLRRITCACDLLTRGQCVNIEDVAYTCGYNNVRSFNRNFKAVHGITPMEYLQQKTGQS